MIKCTCLNCGGEFSAKPAAIKRGRGKYCSVACYNAVRVQRVDRICECCGSQFNTTQYLVEKNGAKYCSIKCSGISRRGEKVERICLGCGVTFFIIPSLVKENGNYCSKECIISTTKRIKRICKVCNKEFLAYPSQLKHDATVYCSRECSGIGLSGENNPRWAGGGRNTRGLSWHRQRQLARKRDGGVCQHCHRKPKKEEARFPIHHIKPYRTFNGDHIAANDLSNLITLCRECHSKAEYGRISIQRPLL